MFKCIFLTKSEPEASGIYILVYMYNINSGKETKDKGKCSVTMCTIMEGKEKGSFGMPGWDKRGKTAVFTTQPHVVSRNLALYTRSE